MLQISQRIQAIIDMCEPVGSIADIGTDHGVTACGLLLQNKAKHIIATDKSAPSLQKAEALGQTLGLGDKMDFRQGDGLFVMQPKEAEGIIVSGMGAPLIIDILSKGIAVAKAASYLVVSAHSYPERIRLFCKEQGFYIKKEETVFENDQYYIHMLILPRVAEICYTQEELLAGKNMLQNDVYKAYLDKQIETAKQILLEMEHVKSNDRYVEVKKQQKAYQTAKEALEEK